MAGCRLCVVTAGGVRGCAAARRAAPVGLGRARPRLHRGVDGDRGPRRRDRALRRRHDDAAGGTGRGNHGGVAGGAGTTPAPLDGRPGRDGGRGETAGGERRRPGGDGGRGERGGGGGGAGGG